MNVLDYDSKSFFVRLTHNLGPSMNKSRSGNDANSPNEVVMNARVLKIFGTLATCNVNTEENLISINRFEEALEAGGIFL